MGIGGISGWQLIILLVIILLLFGTKRIRNIGSDLGSAIKGFRKGMSEDDKDKETPRLEAEPPEDMDQSPSKQESRTDS